MISKFIKGAIITTLAMGIFTFQVNTAEAASKVMWGKTELKIGQIGKVTILKDTNLVKLNNDGSLITVRTLKKGDEFRVYQYKGQHGGLYGVGSSSFVQKDTSKVLYETPSKSKLELIKNINPAPTKPVTPKPPVKEVGDAVDIVPNTMKYIEKNGITVAGSDSNTLFIKTGTESNGIPLAFNVVDKKVMLNPLKSKDKNYNQLNTEVSELVSVFFTEVSYPVSAKTIKSYIDTYITTGLKNGDTKVTGNLYVQRNGGNMYFFTK